MTFLSLYIKIKIYFMEQKNLKISSELHKEIKIICAVEAIKINEWIEKILKEKINQIKNEMDNREIARGSK